MTKVYCASPSNQLHANMLNEMDVLLSFGSYEPFLKAYVQSFKSILLDSGAFGAFNSGKTVDIVKYIDWVQMFPKVDAYAGLDDISGDWRKSLKNYKYGGFPTIHDSDPPELLNDLIPMARERGGWIGIGLAPPRSCKGEFLQRTLERIPNDLHVHGFALREYRKSHVFDSVDSTSWFRDSFRVRKNLPWLTPAECLEIIVKREKRELIMHREEAGQMNLFDN